MRCSIKAFTRGSSMQPANSDREYDDLLKSLANQLRATVSDHFQGREQDWCKSVTDALAKVETAIWQHRLLAKAPNGLFAEVDDARAGLAKQVEDLRNEYDGLLIQATALREEMQHIMAGSKPGMNGKSPHDLMAVRQLTEQFIAAVEK